jgi:formylglycine-generating enzyme required for sulfatase activity/flavodoxin
MKRVVAVFFSIFLLAAGISYASDNNFNQKIEKTLDPKTSNNIDMLATNSEPRGATSVKVEDNFILIKGGTFDMGSPETEAWRGTDEQLHKVTISDFYLDKWELTQAAYAHLTGQNPSYFKGDKLPVENVSWLDAVNYCNLRSQDAGLTPAYNIDGQSVTWDRSADGYRLPTEAEWEYASRAGTLTPFNTENSISAKESNYYGHYPYEIENNYFSQGKLQTKPGEYRQTTVAVGSFKPNKFGLFDMHGNVSEWVWDYYGNYSQNEEANPTGPNIGTLRVYRGGGWNDFAKNLRSAYRGTLSPDKRTINLGIRLARNASPGSGSVKDSASINTNVSKSGKALIVFFSWGGNTRGIARKIQEQTGFDLFEIKLVKPYSNDYSTALDEAQRDQRQQARPVIANTVENLNDYQTILLGYPNWWASIPMPIATFLTQYDFKGKSIIPFCSHGGGRLGQSITAITKLAPNSRVGEPLSVHSGGGRDLENDISKWLKTNGIESK